MVELVDTLASGVSGVRSVEVRVLFAAPNQGRPDRGGFDLVAMRTRNPRFGGRQLCDIIVICRTYKHLMRQNSVAIPLVSAANINRSYSTKMPKLTHILLAQCNLQ